MEALSTKIHQQQAAAVAISQAFDNLAKAAAQVRRVCDFLPENERKKRRLRSESIDDAN